MENISLCIFQYLNLYYIIKKNISSSYNNNNNIFFTLNLNRKITGRQFFAVPTWWLFGNLVGNCQLPTCIQRPATRGSLAGIEPISVQRSKSLSLLYVQVHCQWKKLALASLSFSVDTCTLLLYSVYCQSILLVKGKPLAFNALRDPPQLIYVTLIYIAEIQCIQSVKFLSQGSNCTLKDK
jgi:hypothetical protein